MPQISPCTEKRSASSSTDTTAAPGKPCRILRTAADIAEEDSVRVLLHTAYSEYSRENLHMSDALDFIAEFTEAHSTKGSPAYSPIRAVRFPYEGSMGGLPWAAYRAPDGWRNSHPDAVASEGEGCASFSEDDAEVDVLAYKRAWARLLARVYEVDPLVCPKCGVKMKAIAVIENPDRLGESSGIW